MSQRLADLKSRKEAALHAGSPHAVERQHSKGKMTARERIDYLLDEGSFQELDMLARHRAHGMGLDENRPYTDGVITGFGTVDGRKVCVFTQDFTVNGGSLGEVFGEKIHKIMDLATSLGVPMIGINDGGGARVQEGVVVAALLRRDLQAQRRRLRRHPPDQRDHGPLRRRRRLQPGHDRLHLHGATAQSQMFITGPDVVKTVTGEEVTLEQLGGAMTHATKSGVATFVTADEKSCLDEVRYLLGFLPSNNLEETARASTPATTPTGAPPSSSTSSRPAPTSPTT